MKKTAILLISLFLSLFGSTVYASADKHEHTKFFFRAQLGGGSAKGELVDDTDRYVFERGGASLFNLQVGWAVLENFILYGESSFYLNKNVILIKNEVNVSNLAVEYGINSFSLGTSYYIMPANIYISPSIRFPAMMISLSDPNNSFVTITGESSIGIGYGISIGKEWWVSQHWGLGVALNFTYDRPKPGNGKGKISNQFIGIAFSATYN